MADVVHCHFVIAASVLRNLDCSICNQTHELTILRCLCEQQSIEYCFYKFCLSTALHVLVIKTISPKSRSLA